MTSAITSAIRVVDPAATITVVGDEGDPASVVRVVDPAVTVAVEVESSTPGPAGDAATITIAGVTTGPSGSPAQVQNVGTAKAAALAFIIPAGPPGPSNPSVDDGFF